MSNKAKVIPIDSSLAAVAAQFLFDNMSKRFSVDQWLAIVTTKWLPEVPNYGFALLNEQGDMVGALCALYSEQVIDGETKQFCNPHTWCVVPDYRKNSISLVVAAIRQPGFHFTMFTPNKDGQEIFAYLGFKPLAKETAFVPNWPTKLPFSKVAEVTNPDRKRQLLSAADRQIFDDHVSLNGVFHLVVNTPEGPLLMLIKKQIFKRMKAAQLIYVSDYQVLMRHWRSVRSILLTRFGFVFTRIEDRFTKGLSVPWGIKQDGHQRFFLSDEIEQQNIQYLYSEIVAMKL